MIGGDHHPSRPKSIDDSTDQAIELLNGLTYRHKGLLLGRQLVTYRIDNIVVDIDHPRITNGLIGLGPSPAF